MISTKDIASESTGGGGLPKTIKPGDTSTLKDKQLLA